MGRTARMSHPLNLLMLLVQLPAGATAANLPYNETIAVDNVWFNQAVAAVDVAALESWTCGRPCQAAGPLTSVRVLHEAVLGVYAVAAHYGGQCILVFRGTKNVQNVIMDGFIVKAAPFASCPECRLHGGFVESWRALRGRVYGALEDLGCAARGIQMTGHSLGGALASITAWDLVERGYDVRQVYTYGEPRVGNDAWVRAFRTRLAKTSYYRIVEYKDPVPHIPPRQFGYAQSGPEVYYYATRLSSFRVCAAGEDEQCSGQWSFLECIPHGCFHCSYLGMNPCTPNATEPRCEEPRPEPVFHV
mmetsp:Transcript_57822/g.163179  ORF Transcript_57822/g.163179 Transcript_57822/m.163179 type:complete len:304 (+) Transcript_57822:120-1031(+)